ncbi:hypothetical protein [Burkholderia territorii]|uniref:hypothetical protein n=1 Tax=Burkholderia territorii TaxID=1503055 RepID=UPI001E35858E|nr:hypothetical protein [Burkholderia territorii]
MAGGQRCRTAQLREARLPDDVQRRRRTQRKPQAGPLRFCVQAWPDDLQSNRNVVERRGAPVRSLPIEERASGIDRGVVSPVVGSLKRKHRGQRRRDAKLRKAWIAPPAVGVLRVAQPVLHPSAITRRGLMKQDQRGFVDRRGRPCVVGQTGDQLAELRHKLVRETVLSSRFGTFVDHDRVLKSPSRIAVDVKMARGGDSLRIELFHPTSKRCH